MENASKALIIAGAILLSILIIAVGMFIFTSSQSTIDEGASQISAQERQAFNRQFNQYAKTQTGTNVSDMITTLIANANSNKDESERLPDLLIATNASGTNYYVKSEKDSTNVKGFTKAKNMVESRHNYYVQVWYNPATSLIDLISCGYAKNDFDNLDPYDEAGTLAEHGGATATDLPAASGG